MPPRATPALLKAVAALRRYAHKARDDAPRRPHVRAHRAEDDSHVVAAATREDKILAGKALLQQRLAFLTLRNVDMEDDGNCQFRAVSHELFGTQDHHLRVREQCVKYLAAHEQQYAPFVGTTDDFKAYCARLATPKTWGDELTLQAACATYAVDIHVVTTEAENFHLHYCAPAARRRLFLSYIAPIHYNVVVPTR
mmetsp:Transcript_22997/g.72049  ORF Transcript_22997/g.72049 Transcript_22997/m.72049 type:complete len:196 (-) Transcript_22997:30-617(-)